MNPILFKLLMTLVIEGAKYLRDHYDSLSPEQREALEKATKENFDHAGSMGPDVNE